MDAYSESMETNMLTSNPLIDLMYRRGRVRRLAGGAMVEVDVEFGFNPGAQWFSGADVLDMTPFELATRGQYPWKTLHAPVTYTGEEERKNRGEYAKKNLVQAKIRATEDTQRKVLEIAMYGDGTANNGKVILGLDAIIPTTATSDPAVGSIGNISVTGNPWWQNYAVTSFGSFAANGPGGTAADAWLSAANTVSDGPKTFDVVISAQDLFEFYNRALVNQSQIIMNQNATGDLTFPSLTYGGRPWFWSRSIPPGRAYFIRLSTLEFIVHSEANFTLTEFVKAFNQDLYGASMLTMCIFLAKSRIWNAVIDGATA